MRTLPLLALTLGLGVVVVRGALVQDEGVAQPLHIAGTEFHVEGERRIVGGRLVQREQFATRRIERRHRRQSLGVPDVPGDEERLELFAIKRRDRARQCFRQPTRTGTGQVEEPGLEQERRQIRAQRAHRLVHAYRTDETARATGRSRRQAQQSDHVGAISVEVLLGARAIEANVRIAWIRAGVADVGEQLTVEILGHRPPDRAPHHRVEHRQRAARPALYEQPPQQDEPWP